MHGSYWYEGLSQVKVRIVTTAFFVEHFCNTFFRFVLCIHLVPSCNSLLMFVSNFSVSSYWRICLFFICSLTYSVNKNLDYSFVYLSFICEFTQSVKTRISLSIYLHIYLFVYSFTWIFLYLFTHNLYIFLLVSSICLCFHWMKM